METRSNLQVVRDCLAVVRDVLFIALMAGLIYGLLRAGAAVHDLQQLGH